MNKIYVVNTINAFSEKEIKYCSSAKKVINLMSEIGNSKKFFARDFCGNTYYCENIENDKENYDIFLNIMNNCEFKVGNFRFVVKIAELI